MIHKSCMWKGGDRERKIDCKKDRCIHVGKRNKTSGVHTLLIHSNTFLTHNAVNTF